MGLNRVEHPLLVGKLAHLEFRVHQIPVERQLETAAAGRDQLQLANLLLERRQQLGRQTDGLGLVTSGRAIRKGDIHLCSSVSGGDGVFTPFRRLLQYPTGRAKANQVAPGAARGYAKR